MMIIIMMVIIKIMMMAFIVMMMMMITYEGMFKSIPYNTAKIKGDYVEEECWVFASFSAGYFYSITLRISV